MENKTYCLNERKKTIRAGRECDATLFGAFPNDCTVNFELSFPRRLAVTETRMEIGGDPAGNNCKTIRISVEFSRMSLDSNVFSFSVDVKKIAEELSGAATGLFYYHYELETDEGTLFFGGEEREPVRFDRADGAGRQLLVYDSSFETPDSFKGGIIYQIFPDRFRRSGKVPPGDRKTDPDWDHGTPQFGDNPGAPVKNDVFFGGDLYGIAEKLPYIKSLGVTAIYLNPVFSSPSNHRYDTADYMKVDELLGGDGALEELVSEAKKLGIALILDGVFAHTGADSVYFNKYHNYPPEGACDSPSSPYYSWYSFEKYPDKYACWWGVDVLPKVNADAPSFRKFILGPFLKKWMNTGVSGWRIDVADELSDGFLADLRGEVKKYGGENILIGEVWEDASNKISYGKRREYLRGGSLDSVMNYPLRKGLIDYMLRGDEAGLRYAAETLYRHYPKCVSDALMNPLSTHDTVRILTEMGDEDYDGLPNRALAARRLGEREREIASRRLVALYGVLAALPGIPSVFYGDEAGLEGYRDPFCRMPFPWGREDPAILSEFRRVGEFRKKEPVLKDGLFETEYLDGEVFVFSRRPCPGGEGRVIITALNRSVGEKKVVFPYPVRDADGGEAGNSVILASVSSRYLTADP